MIFQKKEWLAWPAAGCLRTAVRNVFGHGISNREFKSSTDFFASSGLIP